MTEYVLPGTGLLFPVATAAEILTVKPKTIRAWVASGKLGHVKLGRTLRIPEAAIRELVIAGRIPKRKG